MVSKHNLEDYVSFFCFFFSLDKDDPAHLCINMSLSSHRVAFIKSCLFSVNFHVHLQLLQCLF